MPRVLALGFLLWSIQAHAATSPVGLWLTQDHDGVISISECDGGLCAEIAGVILDRPDDPTPVDYRGVSQCHLNLITDARPIQPNLWKGHILDPRSGALYGLELHLDPHGDVLVRGFLGFSLLGQTQTWTPYTGEVPGDCRLHAGSMPIGQSPTLPSGQGQAQ